MLGGTACRCRFPRETEQTPWLRGNPGPPTAESSTGEKALSEGLCPEALTNGWSAGGAPPPYTAISGNGDGAKLDSSMILCGAPPEKQNEKVEKPDPNG